MASICSSNGTRRPGWRRRLTTGIWSSSRLFRLASTPARSSSGRCAASQLPWLVARRTDLGDQHEILGVGVERLVDQLVGDVRAVELGGVDVVDAGVDGPAQHRERLGAIGRRSEHAGAGELHGAEPHPVHRAPAKHDGVVGHRSHILCRERMSGHCVGASARSIAPSLASRRRETGHADDEERDQEAGQGDTGRHGEGRRVPVGGGDGGSRLGVT